MFTCSDLFHCWSMQSAMCKDTIYLSCFVSRRNTHLNIANTDLDKKKNICPNFQGNFCLYNLYVQLVMAVIPVRLHSRISCRSMLSYLNTICTYISWSNWIMQTIRKLDAVSRIHPENLPHALFKKYIKYLGRNGSSRWHDGQFL